VIAKDFLTKINAAFEKNSFAVQGHRAAKNMNTSLAILDAASEEINNHIFRKGHRAVGLSSAIKGSGMDFRYSFLKKCSLSLFQNFTPGTFCYKHSKPSPFKKNFTYLEHSQSVPGTTLRATHCKRPTAYSILERVFSLPQTPYHNAFALMITFFGTLLVENTDGY